MKRALSGSAPWRTTGVDLVPARAQRADRSSRSACPPAPPRRGARSPSTSGAVRPAAGSLLSAALPALRARPRAPRGRPAWLRARSRRGACSGRRTCRRRVRKRCQIASDLVRRTGPIVFQSACRRRISRRRPFPLARGGQLFGARAERFLLRLVGGPGFLALAQVGVAAGEELVARVAEPLPGDSRVLARDRADLPAIPPAASSARRRS